MHYERRGLLLVGLAVLAFSTSPIFIVWADPMPALVKTWGRLFVAAIAVGFAAWVTVRQQAATQTETPYIERSRSATVMRFALYGLVAALHFFFADIRYAAGRDFPQRAFAQEPVGRSDNCGGRDRDPGWA